MKRFDKNIAVFILVFLIIFGGLASGDMLTNLKGILPSFAENAKIYGKAAAFKYATDSVEKTLSGFLTYHDEAIDINSVFNRVAGRAIIKKDDMTVVRAENGYLGNPRGEISDDKVNVYAQNLKGLLETVKGNKAEFLYVMAPTKGYSLKYPSNVQDYTASNCDRFISRLKELYVPCLNLIDCAQKEGISDEEMFFATDHHWRPRMGLWASDKVCGALNDKYGFEYDSTLWDIDNYEVTTYKNWFLGSQGKKVGRYFGSPGTDDIELIVPEFETSLTEQQPAKELWREGTFEDLLYMENINIKDHYNLNPYATYSGGDFREQIITNRLNPRGKTAVIIRDSYGCAFTPFISLAFGKTHVVDIRDGGYVGEKLNLPEYLESLKPDYVIVLYTGLTASDSLYTFQ